MVYVEGHKEEEAGNFLKEKSGFFIDRYEVTNKQYKEFIDNGGYGKPDYRYNIDINVTPFFKLLGTPEKDKSLRVFETDHYVPKNEMIKEVLAWCDKYLGPVKFKNQ